MSLRSTAVGIHASADGGAGVGWEQPVRQEIATLKPEVIKFQSSHDPRMVGTIVQDNLQHIKAVIIRAFLDWGGRPLIPQDFVNGTLEDTERTVNQVKAQGIPSANIIVELHNEPNLTLEGLSSSWQNGTECLAFFAQVLDQFKARIPDVKYGMGALSPGGSINIRRDSKLFLKEMMQHSRWNDFNVHLVHLYTTGNWDNDIWWLDHCQAKTPANMGIWITESSFHTSNGTSGTDYAAKLVELLNRLDQRPTRGVTFYCVSASNPDFQHEAWCRSTNGGPFQNVASRGIAAEIRRLRP
jgi:hypothetical protein